MSQIKYYSTNHTAPKVSFGEALLKGLAPDKGLYLPDSIPTFTLHEIESFAGKSYAEIAFEVFTKFFGTEIPSDELLAMCHDAYDFDVPLEHVYERKYVMRLDQGPTASFKDFAGRMMGRLMHYFLKQKNSHKLILTATSGDTGSAVAHAFHNLSHINVAVLFPIDEVSDRQRKQMTTLQNNIRLIAITKKFDDAQALVKEAFSDSDLEHLELTSANSINIGRLIPQIVYYIYAYSRLSQSSTDKITFSIPSGNFGDMMGCVLASKMGLPIKKILVAINENNEFEQLLLTKKYAKINPSINCVSNAMNVGHPSNLARLIELYGGNMNEKGEIITPPDYDALDKDFFTVSVDDDLTKKTIGKAWKNYSLLLEPHGAVGWHCLQEYCIQKDISINDLCVSLETAHPAKFPQAVVEQTGIEPELPESMKDLENLDETYDSLNGTYPEFKEFLLRLYK
ncbi:MAG: threonine synthase [Bacteroidales bacterium]|jgi:threonine synthase|nr:threonine synthase [Bacteroidales bacterium]